MMTLDEAIKHCEEKSDCSECGREHELLASWLKELKKYKEKDIKKRPVKIVDRYNPKLGEIQVGRCPSCNMAVWNYDRRCISCNQSLDWESTESN